MERAARDKKVRIGGKALDVSRADVRDRVGDPERQVRGLDLGEVVLEVHCDPIERPLNVPKAGRVDGARHPNVAFPREELVDVRPEVRREVVEENDTPLPPDGREYKKCEEEVERRIARVAFEQPPRDGTDIGICREQTGYLAPLSRPEPGRPRARAAERMAKRRKSVLRVPRSLPTMTSTRIEEEEQTTIDNTTR